MEQAFEIVKRAVQEVNADISKLEAVRHLIGDCAVECKKRELLMVVFALQNVQSKILDARIRAAGIDEA